MTALYFAHWTENEATPGKAPATGSWNPAPWEQARATLADQLRRNLDLWSRPETRGEYENALSHLETRFLAERPGGVSLHLRDHTFSLLPSEPGRG